ncbi:hypothetical protein ACI78V_06480 [Geodermatophilus sp. SYSU D00742]
MKDSRPARIIRANKLTFLDWLLTAAGFASAVWGLAETAGDWTPVSASWVVLSTVLGVFFLGRSMRQWKKQHAGPRPERVTRRVWGYSGPYSSWRSLGVGRTHAVYSPELNRRLASEDPIAVEVDGEWYPKGRAGQFRDLQLQRLRLNERKYRLATDLLEDSPSVRLQVTDYAAFMATNRLAYEAWRDVDVNDVHLDFEMVEQAIRDEGKLPRLVHSNCSNHLGGDLLAVGNGVTYLQKQKTKALMYGGEWVGSASGSFDLTDLTPSGTLQDLVKTGLLRELREEMALPAHQVPGLEATKVVGYSRATYLGGKPQFYAVCRIGDVEPGGDEYTERFHEICFDGGADGLIAALERFEDRHEDQFSPPLQMLIRVVQEWLLDDPGADEWLWPDMATPGRAGPGGG